MSAREDREDDASSEGEGDDIRPYGAANDGLNDSSEEEDDDEEEEQRVKAGFIVDDDEEDDAEEDFKAGEGEVDDDEARRARRKEKRRKKRKREHGSAELLEEDDLDLIAENTGQVRPSQASKDARALKRFRRRASGSGGESEDEGTPLPELNTMFDTEPAARPRRVEEDEDSDGAMDDFIVDEEDGEGGDAAEIRKRKEERKKARRNKDDKWAGVSRETQTELMDIFGDGYDYDDGLPDEDEVPQTPEAEEKRYQDFFDPAEIASRFMTDKDEMIRRTDIPERHQLTTSTLSANALVATQEPFPDFVEASEWVATRVSARTAYMFLDPDASYGQREIQPRYELREQYMAAVKDALQMLFEEHFEVPYMWHHKRDYFIEATPDMRPDAVFLNEDELWACYDYGIKYKAIHARLTSLEATYSAMKEAQPGFADQYFEDYVLASPSGTARSSVEAAGEASEWLELRYPRLVKAVKEAEAEERQTERRRAGGLEVARQNRDTLGGFLDRFGLSPAEVAAHHITARRHPRSTDYPVAPLDAADEFVNADNHLLDNTTVLNTARTMLISEFGKDPVLRDQFRHKFRLYGMVSTMPTDRGKVKIDQYHIYYPFKYLKDKPLPEFDRYLNFPQMLAAEEEGLVKITFSLPNEVLRDMESDLIECYSSVEAGTSADKWNALRIEIIQAAIHSQLIPAAAASTREYLRERNEEAIITECALDLRHRVNVTPLCIKDMRRGDSPAVVALTCGRGFKDAIVGVFVENNGRVTRQIKLDELTSPESKENLIAFLETAPPDLVILGGFNLATHQLHVELKKTLRQMAGAKDNEETDPMDPFGPPPPNDIEAPLLTDEIPLAYVHDAVARVYMNSVQGREEHPSWPANMRYAFALARYAQDPLNEFCALGADVVAVQYNPMQRYVSQERLLISLERALVTVVNAVGVDINAAYTDTYLQKLLPFLSGLGPRKAEALLKGIQRAGGTLINRSRLLVDRMVGSTISNNLAAFLYLNPGGDLDETDITDKFGGFEGPNPLDSTRIHPLDYDLAYALTDQLMGVDPEDSGQVNPSLAALRFLQDKHERKDDTSAGLMAQVDFPQYSADVREQSEGRRSRAHVLLTIKEELLQPYRDRRRDFFLPSEDEIFTMLTGETPATLTVGLIVTAKIVNIRRENAFGRLDSGIEANIPAHLMHDSQQGYAGDYVSKGQTVRGVVVDMNKKAFTVTLAMNAANMAQARPIGKQDPDPFTDTDQQQREEIEATRKKRQDMASTARIIKHPLWQLFNKQQAEAYLGSGVRGDAVIRPSSQGLDHLAITWKVDEGIYQHVDVLELEKTNPYALGKLFRVGTASYMDLDEVLINHVKAVAAQVDKLTDHEKYHPEDVIDQRLDDYVKAHPGQSAYGFCLDSGKPGWAQLRFLSKSTRDGGKMQAWPVRILPGAFKLFSAEVPGMRELCDAFKAQYRAKLEEQKNGPIGRTPRAPGATPMGGTPMAGGRTPGGYGGRTPGGYGGRTPGMGGAPAGFPSATPNPYQMPSPYRPPGINAYGNTPAAAMGARTPGFGAPVPGVGGRTPGFGAPHGAGGQTPMGPPPGMPPPGPPPARPSAGFINPERMRMMAQQGGHSGY